MPEFYLILFSLFLFPEQLFDNNRVNAVHWNHKKEHGLYIPC